MKNGKPGVEWLPVLRGDIFMQFSAVLSLLSTPKFSFTHLIEKISEYQGDEKEF